MDVNNLAYELTFLKEWDWNIVKKKTVLALYGKIDRLKFINEKDNKRYRGDKRNNNKTHVMVLGNSGGKSGFKIFQEIIEYCNEKAIDKWKKELINSEDQDDFEYDEEGFWWNEIDETTDTMKKISFHKNGNGTYTFEADSQPVMYAIPCCPHCHNRLPIGWDIAEDFGAVSLMGRSGSGKTTYLLSMMHNWKMFPSLHDKHDRQQLNITAAHLVEDTEDVLYAEMKQASEKMCCLNGECPDNTNTESPIPPVFLKIMYGDHTMIIGIYDNAGENLRKMDTEGNPNLKLILHKYVFAEFYLFDPEDLNINLPKQKEQVMLKKCEMLSLEEQGKYQVQNLNKCRSGEELLEEMASISVNNRKKQDIFEVYNSRYRVLMQERSLYDLKNKYFLGIIIKSDLLEPIEEIKEKYSLLFEREALSDMLNADSMTMREELVKEMIENFNLIDPEMVNQIELDFGEINLDGTSTGRRTVSWHCISALGCDTDEDGRLLGEYAPIRVAEPLVTCILKRIADIQWTRR